MNEIRVFIDNVYNVIAVSNTSNNSCVLLDIHIQSQNDLAFVVTIVHFAYGLWKKCVIDSSYFSVSNATVDAAKEITVMKTEVDSPAMSQRLYSVLINGRSSTFSALGKLPQ